MFWIRLLVGGVLAVVGLIGVALNFWVLIREVRGRDAPSPLPVFAGLVAAVGMAVLPFRGALLLAVLPVWLDWGGCLQAIGPLIRRRRGKH